MLDDDLDPDLDPDQSLASTDDRWFAYKRACSDRGTEPMGWGDWLVAGQPVPVIDGDRR